VEIVDTASASMGIGLVAVACAKAARSGASLGDLVAMAKDLSSRTKVWAALDTLENLKKNGRIGGAKAMLATALSIKPIITVTDGAVGEGGKQRTRGKALAFLVDRVREAGPIESLAILHAQCPDVEQFTAMIREVYSGDITVGDIGAVIGAHAGPGTIGVAFHVAR
jgi:DegV family protein with EDD domain